MTPAIRPLLLAGLVLALAAATGRAEAPPIELALPIDCVPGVDCWVTNYFVAREEFPSH